MRRVRCCAVGLRVDPTRATSTSTFLAAMHDLLDREVQPHPSAPTLVAFPEHTGLVTMFVGPRGAAARERLVAGAGTLEALMALATSYGEVLGHYAGRFPEVHSAGTLLHLACTDVMVRTIVDGFSTLAADRGIWLTVGAALPDWELRHRDGLDGEVAATLLGPEPVHDDVYVPTGPQVRNRNLVFAPDGGLVAVHDKAYLVPLEADAEEGLGLQAAGLDDIHVAELPIGRVGIVISKDAWMPDVNERLSQLGAQVVIQSEAFDRWALVDRDADGEVADLWPPDKFQRGGWWMVQRHAPFRVNVAPMLLGVLGDLRFDGQALVAVPASAGRPQLGLLGQPHDGGWAAVGPWGGFDEPASGLADEQRRPAFEEHARSLAPGSDGPRETPVSEGAVWADVAIPDAVTPATPLPRPAGLPASSEVQTGGTQLVPDLVSDGTHAWLAWIEVDGPEVQRVAVARGDGMSWGGPEPIGSASGHCWRPRLVMRGGSPSCLFLGFPNDNWEVFVSSYESGWQAPLRVDDAHDDAGVLRERLHDAPTLQRVGDRLLAVWSDVRWPWVLPQVRYAWSTDEGATWSCSARIDGRATEGQADPLQPRSIDESRGQTSPAIAVTVGAVLVAYHDRDEDGGPAIRLCRLIDGVPSSTQRLDVVGATPEDTPTSHRERPSPPPEGPSSPHEAPTSVDDTPTGASRVARPVLAAAGTTVWVVWERWEVRGGAALMMRISHDGGVSWSDPRPVDPDRPAGVTQRHATLVPTGRGGVCLVHEDDRPSTSTVAVTHISDQGDVAPPVRLDDAPVGAHARAPTATLGDGHLVVAWQDTRDGTERIRTVRIASTVLR